MISDVVKASSLKAKAWTFEAKTIGLKAKTIKIGLEDYITAYDTCIILKNVAHNSTIPREETLACRRLSIYRHC